MEKRDIRICFIGDSFTNGTGDETYLGWTGRLCASALKNDVELTFYNLGVRRQTSTDILQRWEQECAQRLPDFCDGRVVLSCGVNDMVMENGNTRIGIEDSLANVSNMLQLASSRYKTLMVGPAPVGNDDLNGRIKVLSIAYQHVADKLDIPYIEVFSQLVGNRQYIEESRSNDGYHPESYGYTAIANIIRDSNEWWFR